MSALGTHQRNNAALAPAFPMCVHQTFSMERTYDANRLAEVMPQSVASYACDVVDDDDRCSAALEQIVGTNHGY